MTSIWVWYSASIFSELLFYNRWSLESENWWLDFSDGVCQCVTITYPKDISIQSYLHKKVIRQKVVQTLQKVIFTKMRLYLDDSYFLRCFQFLALECKKQNPMDMPLFGDKWKRRIVWVCLTILWDWRVKVQKLLRLIALNVPNIGK